MFSEEIYAESITSKKRLLFERIAREGRGGIRKSQITLKNIFATDGRNLMESVAIKRRRCYKDSLILIFNSAVKKKKCKSFRLSDEDGFRESETEVLKQLSSMGRLVVCAGNGAVQSSTNLAFLRHGITIWIDVPLDMVARDLFDNQSEFASFEISPSGSRSEVMTELAALYNKYRDGYATADAVISLQKVASGLGYENLGDITGEEMTLEVLKEIEKLTRSKKMIEEAARPF
ncbi:shikimate kinase [Senna tora]|uniref:Shikimate kinase n=1 Tax=Senna tora TaxID=362788 RepID=A0A834TDQ4_9FABA|nr:shikimate kinase [Senna tora]